MPERDTRLDVDSKAPGAPAFGDPGPISADTGVSPVFVRQTDSGPTYRVGGDAPAPDEWLPSPKDAAAKQLLSELRGLLGKKDAAARILQHLEKCIQHDQVAGETEYCLIWHYFGWWFLRQQRVHEALPLFYGLYDKMLEHEDATQERVHKGLPLVRISDCYLALGYRLLAKRYLMLAACEDVIEDKGVIAPETRGVYFRLVWYHGMSDHDVKRYASRIWELYQENPREGLFPEWIVQNLDQDWMTEYPSAAEAGMYVANRRYVRRLLDDLGSGDGDALNLLAHYLLTCVPGVRVKQMKVKSRGSGSDYDVVCTVEGPALDFRSHLGALFVCECKDWKEPANFPAFAKFCRVLDSAKCRFGVLFSKRGLTGEQALKNAKLEQLKVFHDRDMVIVVVSEKDLDDIANGANLITMLRAKYEQVRLDLTD